MLLGTIDSLDPSQHCEVSFNCCESFGARRISLVVNYISKDNMGRNISLGVKTILAGYLDLSTADGKKETNNGMRLYTVGNHMSIRFPFMPPRDTI